MSLGTGKSEKMYSKSCEVAKLVLFCCKMSTVQWGGRLLSATAGELTFSLHRLPQTQGVGTAILTNRTDIQFSNTLIDKGGNFIITQATINKSFSLVIASIYAPNRDTPEFFQPIEQYMDQLESDIPIMLGGDWNLVLEQERDSYNYRRLNNVRSQRRVLDMINKFDLVDVFRERCPSLNRYTWRVKNPSLKQARLDFFLVSSSVNEKVVGCDIKLVIEPITRC